MAIVANKLHRLIHVSIVYMMNPIIEIKCNL